ncbi:MAG: peptidyl-prolyl cis-trans isomerase [Campylobacterota bacterium]|nr:peptidyl-prolyl cis-trans isomerase [Campylobacterota bacterium]
MKKLLLLTIFTLLTLAQAKMINAVAIAVEGEPITTAEIRAVQTQLGISKKEAQDMLIDNRLQKVAMKDIAVSEDEIDERISLIAKQNNMSVKKMQAAVKQQGMTWNKFRDQIKTAIQKQKFFRTKIAKTIPTPSDDELKIFYRNHPELFSMPSSLSVKEYSASSAAAIQAFLQNPAQKKGVKSRNVTFKGSDLTPQLLAMISQTPKGSFTPAFNNGNAYVTYKVLGKGKGTLKPFDDVKNNVIMAWKKEQQGEAIKDYFEKMKSKATIEIIRP